MSTTKTRPTQLPDQVIGPKLSKGEAIAKLKVVVEATREVREELANGRRRKKVSDTSSALRSVRHFWLIVRIGHARIGP